MVTMTASEFLDMIHTELLENNEQPWAVPVDGSEVYSKARFHAERIGHTLYVVDRQSQNVFEVMVCESSLDRWREINPRACQ